MESAGRTYLWSHISFPSPKIFFEFYWSLSRLVISILTPEDTSENTPFQTSTPVRRDISGGIKAVLWIIISIVAGVLAGRLN